MNVPLPPYSMWTKTKFRLRKVTVDGEEHKTYLPALMVRCVSRDPSDQVYVVTARTAGRLSLISQKFYGVPDLWWVISQVNYCNDPLLGFPVGTRLAIPTSARLAAEGVLPV